jgi:hypothetical protein
VETKPMAIRIRVDIHADVCPNCKKVTVYYVNPMYCHVCEHCGHRCSQCDLLKGVYADKIKGAIKELQKEIVYLRGLLDKPEYVKVSEDGYPISYALWRLG